MLALSALQFTYTFPPSSYLNVVQQLSVTSFVLFGLVRRSLGGAVFCIIHACTWSQVVAHRVTLHAPACQKQNACDALDLENVYECSLGKLYARCGLWLPLLLTSSDHDLLCRRQHDHAQLDRRALQRGHSVNAYTTGGTCCFLV